MRRTALALLALAALPAAAQEECPAYDVVADAASAEIVTQAEVTGWAKHALAARYAEGAPCFVFVALISAENATAMYASLRASRQGDRVVIAETQTVATGAKVLRKNKLRKELAAWIGEKAGAAAAEPAPSAR